MNKRIFILAILLVLCASNGWAQSPVKSEAATKPQADYSAEAVYCEHTRNDVRFENDGTGTMRFSATCHIQSEAGVKQFGLLGFPYQRDLQDMELGYVRVRKPGGSVVNTPADFAQDMPADVTRVAPMYSGLRVRQIAVINLRPGDTLEWEYTLRTKAPLIPGQFWYDSSFEKQVITLDEQITLDVPAGRKLAMRVAPELKTASREENGRKIYTWTTALLAHKKVDKKKPAVAEEEDNEPAVQISTFQRWDELGRWFTDIQEDRVAPTAAIKTKADELTRGLTTDSQKAEAIYGFVSREIRYVALEFGIGRFRANPAETVLNNGYGDCKDKHTLLASLLRAVGIEAHPVLIHTSRKLNHNLASPSQVDHVITAVQLGSERVFLDTTTEVAPFGLIYSTLRNKDVLLLLSGGKFEITKTPEQPPFPQVKTLDVVGKVDAAGKFEAEITQTFRGDDELFFRLGFRQTARENWKDVAQAISFLSGFGGEVKDVTTSDVEDFRIPLQVKYHYTRENYITWTGDRGKMRLALPSFGLTDSKDEQGNSVTVKYPNPVTLIYKARITLPPETTVVLPNKIEEQHGFADYSSSYKLVDDSVVAERTLKLRAFEIADKDRDAYHNFHGEVVADEDDLQVTRGSAIVKNDDGEDDSEAETSEQKAASAAYADGMAAVQRNDGSTAARKFQEAVKLNPKHPEAWAKLGIMRLASQDPQDALRCIRKQIDVAPKNRDAHFALGIVLEMQRDLPAALAAMKEQLSLVPGDVRAHLWLGRYYAGTVHDLKSAVPHLEAVVDAGGASPRDVLTLGQAYMQAGETKKALKQFDALMENDPSPDTLNSVGYLLADKDMELDRALEYVVKSMKETADALKDITLDNLNNQVFANINLLEATWDSVGWVYAKRGDMQKARQYLEATWSNYQDSDIADHLSFVYEKLGLKAKAAELKASLAPVKLQELRTIRLKRKLSRTASAEFYFLLGGNGVEDVKYIGGDEELKSWTASLRSEKIPGRLPEPGNAKLVRQGILSCERYNGTCMIVLLPLGQISARNAGNGYPAQ